MDKQPVGQLPDLAQSNNDDEIMVITNSEYNQLKKEKISDLITDFTSTNENNALTKGTDGKMFVTDFGNASNITEGTLPVSVLPDIPKDLLPAIETSDLPVSGVSADTYAYPSSVTVNAQGQVTGIVEGAPGANNANQDLSNLSPEGEKHFINKTQITNCILEIPQNINLELNNGVLTLKAGSIVYVPNGTNIFNKLTISQDISLESITGDAKFLVYVTSSGTGFQCRTIVQSSSGESDPATLGTAYYNILTNIIISHTTNGDVQVSLPIAIVNVSNNTFSSIDKIFNGFGYIGSTIFSLPKVKGLIPNGRNADGTLNNTEFTTSTVRLYTQSSTFSSYENQLLFWGASGVKSIAPYYLEGLEVDKPTSFSLIPAGRVIYFSKDTNKLYTTLSNNVNWLSVDGTYIGKTTWNQDSTQISFTQNGTVELAKVTDLERYAKTDLTNLTNGLANTICTTAPTTVSTASAQRPAVVVENYVNGTSWYRVWSDGWIEQGGQIAAVGTNQTVTVTLLQSFSNTNYFVSNTNLSTGVAGGNDPSCNSVGIRNTNNFQLMQDQSVAQGIIGCIWSACGY